ncbi:MAG TPA: type VI secretion system tube protein Hcp [Polyangiales bacterium]|nr:type VI secretion system tube protein Hcp [Polyangiales bacterium]
MATNIHLKVDKIDGDSEVDKHKKEIQISSWSWGATQSGNNHVAKGGTRGKASFHDIQVTKFMDKSSPSLMKYLSTGDDIAEITLAMTKAAGESGSFDYVAIKLKQCIVSSISIQGTTGDDRVSESVTFNFADFEYKYVETTDKNTAGTPTEFKYSIQQTKLT